MTKAEEILEKHLKINDVETMLGKHGRTHNAVINAINEAINYTHCCEELRENNKPIDGGTSYATLGRTKGKSDM